MNHQAHGYFGFIFIGNVGNNLLTNTLVVSALQNLAGSEQEVQNFYARLRSDIIAKEIGGAIKKTYLNKLRIHQG